MTTPVWDRGLQQADGIEPPLAGIFSAPYTAAPVNEQWKPLVISALAQLAANEHQWSAGYPFGSNEIAKLIECLINGDCLDVACDECGDCITIQPDHPAIEWSPTNPFTTQETPEPYAREPFSLGENSIVPGSLPGDVTSTYYNLVGTINPLDLLDFALTEVLPWALSTPDAVNLFPRFKLRFSGKVRIILTLLAVPEGGLAYITLDGNPIPVVPPFNLQSVAIGEIDSWLSALSLLGMTGFSYFTNKLISERYVVIDVEEPGEHYLDVTFIPRISPGNIGPVTFLEFGFGGGLRKIDICGEAELVDCPDQCVDCPPPPVEPPDLRINNGCVEWLNPNTGKWECRLQLPASDDGCGCEDDDDDCEDCDPDDRFSDDCEEC